MLVVRVRERPHERVRDDSESEDDEREHQDDAEDVAKSQAWSASWLDTPWSYSGAIVPSRTITDRVSGDARTVDSRVSVGP